MTTKGLFKRLLPFFAAFAVGLFIASFFVNVTGPFGGFRERRMKRFGEYQRLCIENQQLRDRNAQLEEQVNKLRNSRPDQVEDFDWHSQRFDVPPPPPPPKAPRPPRQ